MTLLHTEFTVDVDGLTRRYRVVERKEGILTLEIQEFPGTPWQFGHARAIPEGMTAVQVADVMARFVNGEFDSDEYRDLLSRE